MNTETSQSEIWRSLSPEARMIALLLSQSSSSGNKNILKVRAEEKGISEQQLESAVNSLCDYRVIQALTYHQLLENQASEEAPGGPAKARARTWLAEYAKDPDLYQNWEEVSQYRLLSQAWISFLSNLPEVESKVSE